MRIVCCCCGKQALINQENRYDLYTTTLKGAVAAFESNEVICGYCAEDLDENGLFPEEQAQAYDIFEK